MKRFLILCLMVMTMGFATSAMAAPFGSFDSNLSLNDNLTNAFGNNFMYFDEQLPMLNQNLYMQTVFASAYLTESGATFKTAGRMTFEFGELALGWNENENISTKLSGLTFKVGGASYSLSDLFVGLAVYRGNGLEYTPGAGLDTMLIGGGTVFVALAVPGSSNAIDALFAISSNSFDYRAHTPAPAALLLFGTGLAGIIAARKRAKN